MTGGPDGTDAASPLKLVVISQEDSLYLPQVLSRLASEPRFEIDELVILDTRGALSNRRWQVLRWFGVMATARMAWRILRVRLQEYLAGLGMPRVPWSQAGGMRGTAGQYGVPVRFEADCNAPHVIERLRDHGPDVLVSLSAPQVFGDELLSVSRLASLNLHSSLLPDYRGLLPSFWVLYHGESKTGATVHRMTPGIDEGAIAGQREVDIEGVRTMHEVLMRTKRAGGELLRDVLLQLQSGDLQWCENPVEEGSYFTWPTQEEARRFRNGGNSLI